MPKFVADLRPPVLNNEESYTFLWLGVNVTHGLYEIEYLYISLYIRYYTKLIMRLAYT